jgi:hypothetical protein
MHYFDKLVIVIAFQKYPLIFHVERQFKLMAMIKYASVTFRQLKVG